MAQELLTTFENELGGVLLEPATGGTFYIFVGDKIIWSRKEKGCFPDLKELKQRIRDIVSPDKGLGHSEPKGHNL